MQLLVWTQVLFMTTASTLIRPRTNRNAAFTLDHVSQTLDSLEKLLQYFDKNRGSLIVDSMWAIRMIQGGLEDTVRKAHQDNEASILERVSVIADYAKQVSERGLFYAKRNAAVQFNKFSELLSRPFVYENLLGGSIGRIDSSLIFSEESRLNIEPKESDDCLMGTIGSGHYKGLKCTITDKCWRQITDKGQREYSITHQLLFFFLIKHYNCSEAINSKGGEVAVAELTKSFCSNIYSEMEGIFSRGVDPGVDQDLVMEQIMFCGGAGFVEDFVRPSVLEMMLDWQRDDGCYAPYDGSHLPEAIALHSKKSRERALQRRKLIDRLAVDFNKEQNYFMMRKPLSEAELRDGCMMHMSSVAGGALTIYVRAMLQYKLYTDYNFIQYRIQDVRYTTPETYIIIFLAVLAILLVIKLGSVPLKLAMRVISSIRYSRTSKQFHSV